MSDDNDIVTRLRWTLTADTPARYPEIVKAAADEIERLRTTLSIARTMCQQVSEVAKIIDRELDR